MSWLTNLSGLAEKAEGLLNQIDQNAAQTLQKSKQSTPKPSYNLDGEFVGGSSSDYYSHQRSSSTTGVLDLTAPQTSKESPKREHKSSGYASSVSSHFSKSLAGDPHQQHHKEEDKLMDFLNDPVAADKPVPVGSLSRRSSSSSLRSLPVQALYGLLGNNGGGKETVEMQQSSEVPPNSWGKQQQDFLEATAKVVDLEKSLRQKDTEVAVLRVRQQEAESQLQLKTQSLKQLEEERIRLIKELDAKKETRVGGESFLLKIADLENMLEQEKQTTKRTEADYLSRLQKLEDDKAGLTKEVIIGQRTLTEEKLKAKDAVDQLKLARYNLEANKQEFDEYKVKAQRILQAKEKLIVTLKDGTSGLEREPTAVHIELEEMRQERDMLKEDLQQVHLQVYNLKAEITELETQLSSEQRTALETQRHLQEQAQQFQQNASQFRDQCEQLKQEYQFVQDEMRRQQLALQSKLHEKDAEIVRLTNQVVNKTLATVTESELESRIRALTENLIQKQMIIENLQTERHSLSLQLERVSKMHKEAEIAAVRASSTSINIGDESVTSRVPTFLRENPFDTSIAKGVKRAYSTVDRLSVKLNVFLRRYPVARVLIFLYIVVLHVWVMIVLLTYTPEMHDVSGVLPTA